MSAKQNVVQRILVRNDVIESSEKKPKQKYKLGMNNTKIIQTAFQQSLKPHMSDLNMKDYVKSFYSAVEQFQQNNHGNEPL